MGIEFGRMLRAERLRRGLTQAKLGEGFYSPGQVSLLETGRTEPTAEAIQELSARLARAPQTMPWWSAPRIPSESRYIFSSLCAQAACDVREYARAASHAAAAAELAQEGGDARGWWEMTFIQAECLMREGRPTSSLRAAGRLLGHPLLEDDRELRARAHLLYAEVSHQHGDLGTAVEHASTAVALSEDLPARSPVRVAALCTLIPALADSGLLEPAWNWCADLELLIAKAPPHPLVRTAEWVIGNAAYLRSDEETGAVHHGPVVQSLMRAQDIELWARFNRSSAAARLEGGLLGPGTLVAIEHAELALAIAGGSDADQLETALVRARWLHLTGQAPEAVRLVLGIIREKHLLGRHTAAQTSLLHGLCLRDLGRHEEAIRAFQDARDQFISAGAPLRAGQALERIRETARAHPSLMESTSRPA